MKNFTIKTMGFMGCMVVSGLAMAETANFNGNTYKVIEQPGITWEEAAKIAENMEGNWHLATVTSEGEQLFLEQLLEGTNGEYWLGAYQEGGLAINEGWQWVTGERFDYDNWNIYEPNDYNDANEKHLGIRTNINFEWNDEADLGLIHGFVIEQRLIGKRNNLLQQQTVPVRAKEQPKAHVKEIPVTIDLRIPHQATVAPESDLSVFPNPNNGVFSLDFNAALEKGNCTVSIIDAQGALIYSADQSIERGQVHSDISLEDIKPGTYFVRVTDANGQQMKKIIIQ